MRQLFFITLTVIYINTLTPPKTNKFIKLVC